MTVILTDDIPVAARISR